MSAARRPTVWTTGMHYARNLVDAAESLGVDPDRMLAAAGLTRAALQDRTARLPDEKKIALWDWVEARTDDPHLGLHVGEKASFGRWGLVESLFMAAETVEAGIEHSLRFMEVMADGKRLSLSRVGGEARYTYTSEHAATRGHRHIIESDMVYILRLMRHAISATFTPEAVWFSHEQGGQRAEYERLLGPEVRFEEPANAVVFDADWLEEPLQTGDPRLEAPLEVEAARALSEREAADSFAERVEALVRLDPADVTLPDVSDRLHVSPRTLQRRLTDENTSFRAIVDDVRREYALRYLRESGLPMSEISYRLGYSEPSAFFRAVKRWTGTTAQAYRDAPTAAPVGG
jgi:AraC-like DNA-binding protein